MWQVNLLMILAGCSFFIFGIMAFLTWKRIYGKLALYTPPLLLVTAFVYGLYLQKAPAQSPYRITREIIFKDFAEMKSSEIPALAQLSNTLLLEARKDEVTLIFPKTMKVIYRNQERIIKEVAVSYKDFPQQMVLSFEDQQVRKEIYISQRGKLVINFGLYLSFYRLKGRNKPFLNPELSPQEVSSSQDFYVGDESVAFVEQDWKKLFRSINNEGNVN